MAMARRMCRRCAAGSSWLSVSRCRIAANASPGRPITLSSMAWLTAKLDVSGSGSAATSRSKVGLPPADEALGRLAADHLAALLRVVAGLGERLLVLHHVVGRLDDDRAQRVVPGPAGATRDLMELARLEQPGAHTVVLGQSREQDGPDRHVDADAEGVRTADDLQQAGLRERLDQPAVARQHPGVVHADAVAHQPRQGPPEAGGEAEPADLLARSRPSPRGCTR